MERAFIPPFNHLKERGPAIHKPLSSINSAGLTGRLLEGGACQRGVKYPHAAVPSTNQHLNFGITISFLPFHVRDTRLGTIGASVLLA